ncbi:MAG: family 10 glycosylhydrolase, partial [Phycisphaerae bacterium]
MNVAPPIERRSSTLARSCAIAVIALPVLSGCRSFDRRGAASAPGQSTRAIWVTRWDYKTPTDVATVMKNCRAAGFNTVLFQVRGNGTAMYRSRIEPWAEELGGRDPGFDPLKLACREAHRQGLKLQAWVNVVPGWRGKGPPDNRRQLYHAHPDWFWRDACNRRQPFGWYNSLNPCYPEVRAYLVSVMREIVTRYDVDGLHLDYIRFPNDWHDSYLPAKAVPDYPRDRRTLALFRRDTGQTPTSNPKAWDRWRTEQITRLVGDIRRMIRRTVPRMTLTAAVGADRQAALRRHFQDTRRWMADGLLRAAPEDGYAPTPTGLLDLDTAWRELLHAQLALAAPD